MAKVDKKSFEFITSKIDKAFGDKICKHIETVHITGRLPWDEVKYNAEDDPISEFDEAYHRKWMDRDLAYLRKAMYKWFKIDYPFPLLHDAVNFIASNTIVNPIENFLQNLPYVQEMSFLSTWLLEFCGAYGPPRRIIEEISRKFVLGMVNRAIHPGAKMDYMLILEGDQGIGKSQLCRIMAGMDEFYSEEMVDLRDSKSTIENYSGKMLVEIPELSSFTKQDQRLLKGFLTKTHDSARMAYARNPISVPRTFSFVGTTNDLDFLQDETGGRRFWPIICKKVDIDGLKAARHLILAEAYHIVTNELEPTFITQEVERDLDVFRKKKLTVDYNLVNFLEQNIDDILISADEEGRVPYGVVISYISQNFFGKPSTGGISLALQFIGGIRGRSASTRYWTFPKLIDRH